MAGVRKKPSRGGNFQGWYVDASGRRKFFTGTQSRNETVHMAQRFEDEHRQVRLGYRPARTSADRHKDREFSEVVEEYLSWGRAQGGRGGRQWSSTHARNRRTHLHWWHERLGLQRLADVDSILPRVEKELQGLQKLGRTGKTIANYAEALTALCDWCVQRGYLHEDVLKGLAPFDTTPQTQRRAILSEEIARLLSSCAPHRRVLYETAFLSGLRANELRNVTLNHLDGARCGLHLDAEWTKNRKPGFQPLPSSLVERLREFAESGEPSRLYSKFYGRADAESPAPANPLLYVPSHPARDLDVDLQKAGIQKQAPGGKIDFHACRLAYINFVIEAGVSIKEAQSLARHSTPDLTLNVYGRTREDRLSEAVERVASMLQPERKRAIYVQRQAVGAEAESATPIDNRELRFPKLVEAAGVEPEVSSFCHKQFRDRTRTNQSEIHT